MVKSSPSKTYKALCRALIVHSWMLACKHFRIANTRKNFHFQLAHQLCDQADMIFVEDINFKMTSRGFVGKQMLDGGFGQFCDLLSWVCWKRGKYFPQVDHKYTSQICPECHTHTGKKDLSQRVHLCSECGYETSRDYASGRVILNRGLNNLLTKVAHGGNPHRESGIATQCFKTAGETSAFPLAKTALSR